MIEDEKLRAELAEQTLNTKIDSEKTVPLLRNKISNFRSLLVMLV